MNKEEIQKVLIQHRNAYKFLLWLDKSATGNPKIFSEDTVTAISDGSKCIEWLKKHKESFPRELLPEETDLEFFANLLSSFFTTSFCVQKQEINGNILEARLVRISKPRPIQRPREHERLLMISALRRLALEEGTPIDRGKAGKIVDRPDNRNDLRIWTYVFDLNYRVQGRAKGTIDHQMWRSMAPDVRKYLTIDVVWEARSRLIELIHAAKN